MGHPSAADVGPHACSVWCTVLEIYDRPESVNCHGGGHFIARDRLQEFENAGGGVAPAEPVYNLKS